MFIVNSVTTTYRRLQSRKEYMRRFKKVYSIESVTDYVQ